MGGEGSLLNILLWHSAWEIGLFGGFFVCVVCLFIV